MGGKYCRQAVGALDKPPPAIRKPSSLMLWLLEELGGRDGGLTAIGMYVCCVCIYIYITDAAFRSSVLALVPEVTAKLCKFCLVLPKARQKKGLPIALRQSGISFKAGIRTSPTKVHHEIPSNLHYQLTKVMFMD